MTEVESRRAPARTQGRGASKQPHGLAASQSAVQSRRRTKTRARADRATPAYPKRKLVGWVCAAPWLRRTRLRPTRAKSVHHPPKNSAAGRGLLPRTTHRFDTDGQAPPRLLLFLRRFAGTAFRRSRRTRSYLVRRSAIRLAPLATSARSFALSATMMMPRS